PAQSADEALQGAMAARGSSRQARANAAAAAAARTDGAYGSIQVEGASLPRLAPPPPRLTPNQQKLNHVFTEQLLRTPVELALTNWRSQEPAGAAAAAPPVTGADGKPLSLGDLVILRAGGNNFAPSAAQIFRAARHAGKTVVSYSNPTDPSKNILRPPPEVNGVPTIEGVPVPEDLRGKIFIIGDPDNHYI